MYISLLASLLLSFSEARNGLPSYGHDLNCADSGNMPLPLTNTSFSDLPRLFGTAEKLQDAASIEQIKNTLSLYPLAIDGKSFDQLSLVFTEDAVANYSAPLNILAPLSNIKAGLAALLTKVNTQHHLGTQVIELFGSCAARSVTYVQASHLGRGKYQGEVLVGYGQYRDVLVRTAGGWRVKERTLALMGPTIGNPAIFT